MDVLLFFSGTARIITNLMLTQDVPLLVNYGVALTLNSSIIISALYFRRDITPTGYTKVPSEEQDLPIGLKSGGKVTGGSGEKKAAKD